MCVEDTGDALALGQRIVAVLETGLRTATYKLSALLALVDFCVENLPDDAAAAVVVPFSDLGSRVIELYWQQVRPFEGQELKQSTQSKARILQAVHDLWVVATEHGLSGPVARVPEALPKEYAKTVRAVVLTLVQQPLGRLQRLPGSGQGQQCFLYDDSWMADSATWHQIDAHGTALELFPGVASSLARLSGLLRPVIQGMWTDDVRHWNKAIVDTEAPDIGGHLFGRSRRSLEPARVVLTKAFGPQCFYCGRETPISHVDHVLPWSKVGIDGLANLVLACRRCNEDKKHALPAISLVDAALARDASALHKIGDAINWPVQVERTRRGARGLYRAEPASAPTWAGYQLTEALVVPDPPPSWFA